MAAHLRVYSAPEEETEVESAEPRIRVQLGDLLPLVALAHRNNYLWLRDFLNDDVEITSDLYDVLQAFQDYRPSA